MIATDHKQQSLDSLANQIIQSEVCRDLAAQATQLVFGTGNPSAEIVLIGEAPGKKEDILGQPFVGAAGRFLDEMLATIGWQRAEVYITNIVKYRPPNNRDPLPAEKAVFLPYLQAQLEIIQPKLVVTLGRHSLNCFLPDLHIGQAHGQPQRLSSGQLADGSWGKLLKPANYQLPTTNYQEVVILPLYHPAAALYNGAMRQTLMDDFAKIPAVLKSIN